MAVQEILDDLWEAAHMDGPIAERVERGGYLVEKEGETHFMEHQY